MLATSECMRQMSTRETRLGEAFRSQYAKHNNANLSMPED